MPQSIFIFDFGTNEEAAQQARHKIDAWKQGFRLGNKMTLKFEREEAAPMPAEDASQPARKSAARKPSDKKGHSDDPPSRVKLFLKLDFSDHEKLSHQRWLDRIPNEEPFKAAKPEIVRGGDPQHAKVAELFDSLD